VTFVLKVVELKLFGFDEEMDQLVAFRAHAAARANVLKAWILVVLVEPVLAPRDVRLLFRKRQHAHSLHLAWHSQAGNL
jgi:hypothetical protein